jgi:hypothetical protein
MSQNYDHPNLKTRHMSKYFSPKSFSSLHLITWCIYIFKIDTSNEPISFIWNHVIPLVSFLQNYVYLRTLLKKEKNLKLGICQFKRIAEENFIAMHYIHIHSYLDFFPLWHF